MIENLSSKIDTLPGTARGTTVSKTDEINLKNMASTSRPTEVNELTQVGGHYTYEKVVTLMQVFIRIMLFVHVAMARKLYVIVFVRNVTSPFELLLFITVTGL